MTRLLLKTTIIGVLFPILFSFQSPTSQLKKALTFYASFDHGTTADFSLGDASMYTAKGSYVNMKRELDSIEVGMHHPDHGIRKGKGRFGKAFEFGKKRTGQVIFYKSKGNLDYDPQNWSGSISFWLSVDPSKDLKGYTDPVQITDVNFNDASIWVDFTDDNPPNFRLGVIGDKDAWSLDTLKTPIEDVWDKRIVKVAKPSFSRNKWTHILITYNELGTANSLASLYLDGKKQGTVSGIDDPFTWDLETSNIFLGLGFTGLMDELAIFNVSLTEAQAMELFQLEGGIKTIL